MKIVFFGTPEIAATTLKALYDSNIEIEAVVTQPDKAVGRKKALTPPAVKVTAEELGIKVIQPKSKKQLKKLVKEIKVDFFVVIAFGMILTEEILEIPKHGAINIHASLLPKYRGASPIQESLLNGDKETGISIMRMDEELDHGPIYLIRKIDIAPEDNIISLTEKLSKLSTLITPLILTDILEDQLTPIPQNHEKASYCKKIDKEDGQIDWGKSAKEICDMIKAYTPWPSAYTNFQGKKIKILEAKEYNETSEYPPGTFFSTEKTLKISTGKGIIAPSKVQLEGKKEMDAHTFLNGYKNGIRH